MPTLTPLVGSLSTTEAAPSLGLKVPPSVAGLSFAGAVPSVSVGVGGLNLPIIPNGASIGAEVDTTWASIVNTAEGGISGRLSLHDLPLRQFHLTIGPVDAAEVRAIFNSVRGQRYPVAIRDWSDYTFTDELQSWTAGGGHTTTSLQQTYQPATGNRSLALPILIPDQREVALTIKVNGSAYGGTWSLADYGVLTLNSALSPGDRLTVSGRKLVPACFMDDQLTIKVVIDGTLSIQDVRLREIFQAELQTLVAS